MYNWLLILEAQNRNQSMNLAFPSLVDAKVLHQPPIAPGWRTPPLKEPALLPWVEWGQSTILPLPTIIELLSRALSYYEKNQHLPSVFLLPFLFAKLNSIIPGFLGHLEFTPAVWKIVNHFAAHRSSHRTNLSSNSCKYDFIPKIKGRREHVKSSRMNKSRTSSAWQWLTVIWQMSRWDVEKIKILKRELPNCPNVYSQQRKGGR